MLWRFMLTGYLGVVVAGSFFFSSWFYAVLLLLATLVLLAGGLVEGKLNRVSLLVPAILVVIATYVAASMHILRPDFLLEVSLLQQIVGEELLTLGGLKYILGYSVIRTSAIVLTILGVSTVVRRQLSGPDIARWCGLGGALHLPCAFAIAQPALNISVYDVASRVGHAEAFALGYLVYPTAVLVLTTLIAGFWTRPLPR